MAIRIFFVFFASFVVSPFPISAWIDVPGGVERGGLGEMVNGKLTAFLLTAIPSVASVADCPLSAECITIGGPVASEKRRP